MIDGLGDVSLVELFREEADTQLRTLTAALLALEREPTAPDLLDSCMRAAHSLKGAAQIVGLDSGVRVAHVMEDCLVAAQEGRLTLGPTDIDGLLSGTDVLTRLAHASEAESTAAVGLNDAGVEACLAALARMLDPARGAVTTRLPIVAGFTPADDQSEALNAGAPRAASAPVTGREHSDRVRENRG